MERRIKVWLSVLIALLLAAIGGVLVVNNQLSVSNVALEAASTQLAAELEKIATLTADFESVSLQLTEAQENGAAIEIQLTESKENASALEAQLTEAQANVTSLETQLTEAQETVSALEVQLTEAQNESQVNAEAKQTAEATISTMAIAAQDYEARIADLESYAAEAETRIAELTQVVEAVEAAAQSVDPTAEAETVVPEVDVPMVNVPVVDTPAILENAAQVNVEEIYTDIDNIVASSEDEMSDEAKVEALNALKTELAVYVEELNVALAEISAQEAALVASADSITALEAELLAVQENVNTLNAAIAASEATIAELEGQVAALNDQNASNSAEAQEQIAALTAEIENEKAKAETLTAELTAAKVLLEKHLAELEVYKLSRVLSAGEAYTASTLEETLVVAADGVSAQWNYTNDTISGNAVVITILVNGEEIYRSEALKPGESIAQFQLAKALEAGTYEAIAVTGVYGTDGSFVHSTRVPVAIQVG